MINIITVIRKLMLGLLIIAILNWNIPEQIVIKTGNIITSTIISGADNKLEDI